jgi:hypothetical protein
MYVRPAVRALGPAAYHKYAVVEPHLSACTSDPSGRSNRRSRTPSNADSKTNQDWQRTPAPRPLLPGQDDADRRRAARRSPQIIRCVVALLFACGVVLAIPSAGKADVIGLCSYKSAANQSRELRAKNLLALRAQCHAKSAGHGTLSRVRRPR